MGHSWLQCPNELNAPTSLVRAEIVPLVAVYIGSFLSAMKFVDILARKRK
jgi:hypothetical protein